MQPSTRWTIAVVAVIVIAILLLLLFRRSEPEAPAKSEVATRPAAPKAEPAAPVKPMAGEPLSATAYFGYNRAEVRPGEAPKLDDFAAKLKDRAYDRIDASGHTDRIGSGSYNLALSTRRAERVRAYLAGKGRDEIGRACWNGM